MKTRKLLSKMMVAGLFLLMSTHLFAQSQTNSSTQVLTLQIPQVSLINAVDSMANVAAVTLKLTTNTAGTKISGGTATTFAQVSSVVASSSTRTIQASYDQLPGGTSLEVQGVVPTNGDGAGTFGSATANPVTLSTSSQNIFTGIGTCYTGTAQTDGYVLNWTWLAETGTNYASIAATTGFSTTITLTITATN